jgi:hypothetical protein
MKIEQIQEIVDRHDNISNGQRRDSWDVIADDGEFTIHAKLSAAVEIEALGARIEATPTQEVLDSIAEWERQGIGTD